jgi:7-cyano-7-deazaguanine synthase in queuosine biosynthesis
MKNILIPFSGGLDSTHLLYMLSQDDSVGSIQPIYIKMYATDYGEAYNVNKYPIEIHQCKKIIKEINNPKIKDLQIIDVSMTFVSNILKRGAYSAQHIFIAGGARKAELMAGSVVESAYDEICVGWCLQDINDFDEGGSFSYEGRINTMNQITLAKVKTPIKNISKTQYNLPDNIRQHIWSCEGPRIEKVNFDTYKVSSCSCCNPCGLEREKNIYSSKSFLIPAKEFEGETEEKLNNLSSQARNLADWKYMQLEII